jgi:hypothetical protein
VVVVAKADCRIGCKIIGHWGRKHILAEEAIEREQVLQFQDQEDKGRSSDPKPNECEKILVPFHRPLSGRADEPNDYSFDGSGQPIQKGRFVGENFGEIGAERPDHGGKNRDEYKIFHTLTYLLPHLPAGLPLHH